MGEKFCLICLHSQDQSTFGFQFLLVLSSYHSLCCATSVQRNEACPFGLEMTTSTLRVAFWWHWPAATSAALRWCMRPGKLINFWGTYSIRYFCQPFSGHLFYLPLIVTLWKPVHLYLNITLDPLSRSSELREWFPKYHCWK